MRRELERLTCGLFVCEIKITNPWNKTEQEKCKALIDTGSEFTIICKSIFEQFQVNNALITNCKISTSGNPDTDAKRCPLYITIPSDDLILLQEIVISDLSNRDEYEAIIGVDLLKNFDFVYKGDEYKAWLEY